MTTPITPSTPTSQAAGSAPPTGTWRHPRLDEITRRQQAATFTDQNAQAVIVNALFFLATFVVPTFLPQWIYSFFLVKALLRWDYTTYIIYALRLLPVWNITRACAPLLWHKDDFSDIPLTPSQRALLGLNPKVSKSATPGSHYITPPRYARSTTPRNSGSASMIQGSSPVSARDGSLGASGIANSPFSPSSPLLQKAIGGGAANRRLSFGSHSPLGSTNLLIDSSSAGNTPGTPTPAQGKGASVGLSNRWLYERGRSSPGGRSVFS